MPWDGLLPIDIQGSTIGLHTWKEGTIKVTAVGKNRDPSNKRNLSPREEFGDCEEERDIIC